MAVVIIIHVKENIILINNTIMRNIRKNNSKEYSHQLVIETNGLYLRPHEVVYIRREYRAIYNIKFPNSIDTVIIDNRRRPITGRVNYTTHENL
jgi:FtsP/CotA-like multicopper oxidase with cupredoxin domain